MSDAASAKFLRRSLIAGASAIALFAGLVGAPAVMAGHANAQQITPAPVSAPSGAPMSFADLISHVAPAVVSIQVRQRPGANTEADQQDLPPGFQDFFGRQGRPQPITALGSGFFIDASGIIVTNGHEYPADLVGSDELTDLAVLRVRGGGHFPYVTFDDVSHVRVGDWVVAVGNPFGLDGTATAGIVSALGRRDASTSGYVDFIQTDAAINRGNSGGPTFDLQGRVIGVNSAIFSPTGGNVGIGFAIPSDVASNIVHQLMASGRVARGWLGVSVQAMDDDLAHSLGLPNDHGALVQSVQPGSPAAQAGVQQGDVILTYNGAQIEDSRDLTRRVGATAITRPAQLEVLRAGAHRTLTVHLAERPSEQQLASANPTQRVTPDDGNDDNGTPAKPGAGVQEGAAGPFGLSVRPASAQERTRLGLNGNDGGFIITDVDPSSDLAEKGVRPGDVILQAGGHAVRSVADFTSAAQTAQRAHSPLLMQIDTQGLRRYVAAAAGGAG